MGLRTVILGLLVLSSLCSWPSPASAADPGICNTGELGVPHGWRRVGDVCIRWQRDWSTPEVITPDAWEERWVTTFSWKGAYTNDLIVPREWRASRR